MFTQEKQLNIHKKIKLYGLPFPSPSQCWCNLENQQPHNDNKITGLAVTRELPENSHYLTGLPVYWNFTWSTICIWSDSKKPTKCEQPFPWKCLSKTTGNWDFPGGPVVRTPCFDCRGHLVGGLRSYILHDSSCITLQLAEKEITFGANKKPTKKLKRKLWGNIYWDFKNLWHISENLEIHVHV